MINKYITLIVGILVIISFSASIIATSVDLTNSKDGKIKSTNTENSKWTIMVYHDGDNNLEKFVIDEFLKMSQVDYSNSGINVVELLDRGDFNNADLNEIRFGDWTDTRRGVISFNDVPSDGSDGNNA